MGISEIDRLVGNPFGQKLKGASIKKQEQWMNKSPAQKRRIRRQHRDIDLDGVPDPFDCQPHNPMKQEDFSLEQKNALDNMDSFTIGSRLGNGKFGTVFTLKENPDFVVKIDNSALDIDSEHKSIIKSANKKGKKYTTKSKRGSSMADEMKLFKQNNLKDVEMVSPSKAKMVDIPSEFGTYRTLGIIRPKLEVIMEHSQITNPSKVSKSMLEDIRKNMNSLGSNYLGLQDSLQIGIDKKGNPLIFDTDGIRRTESTQEAMRDNTATWDELKSRNASTSMAPELTSPFAYSNIKWVKSDTSSDKKEAWEGYQNGEKIGYSEIEKAARAGFNVTVEISTGNALNRENLGWYLEKEEAIAVIQRFHSNYKGGPIKRGDFE